MSAEENKAIIRRWLLDLWGKGDMKVADEVYAPDVIDHNEGPGQAPGIEGHKNMVRDIRAAFPDLRFTLDLLVAEDDKVVDRWTMTATNTGPMMGMPATGKSVTMTGIDIMRITNGKIVETWHTEDIAGMMMQLGMMAGPPQG